MMSSRRKKRGNNLIVLDRRRENHRMIYQSDLEELLLLSRHLRDAESAWKQKRACVRDALTRGAIVEPGVHEVVHRYCVKLVVR